MHRLTMLRLFCYVIPTRVANVAVTIDGPLQAPNETY